MNGSLAESKDAFLARFYDRTGLPYVILLDADNGGRDLFRELRRIGIPEDKIIQLNRVFPDRRNDFAMEDILSANFYHRAVEAAYPANPVPQPAAVEGTKRATLYERPFRASHNIGFNKKRVAEAAKKLLATNTEDEETRSNLGTLSGVLIEALRRQVPVVPIGPAAADAGGTGA